MIDNQSAANAPAHQTKKIPIQERSVRVGEVIVVNGHRVNRTLLKQRFAEGSYQAQQTDHFLLFTREVEPKTILVHNFAPEELDADIKHYITLELKPLGILTGVQRFGEILAGIVGSFFPQNVRRAWSYFGANTLQRFLVFLSTVTAPPYPDFTSIGSFATQYQRICELCAGNTFLDAGCESGFLPLLIAERIPFMERVVGMDIRPDMFDIVREFARERHLANIEYIQADLLAEDFSKLGQFDTVTAIGVLEHFAEAEMHRVLVNLLNVTARRLIIIVPYEQKPELVYGHLQLFTPDKLEALGKRCIQHWKGAGQMWLEQCIGGLLLVERVTQESSK